MVTLTLDSMIYSVCVPQWRTYIVLPGAVSSVSAPGLLVQAVGDGEECNVVVPQLCPDSLRLHTMQQSGPLEVNLIPHTLYYMISLCSMAL